MFLLRALDHGLGQVNNIDMSTPELLAKTDAKTSKTVSLFYFKYVVMTLSGEGQGDAADR